MALLDLGQAGAEIVITEAMLDAGVQILLSYWIAGDEPWGGDREIAHDLYQTMAEVEARQLAVG